MKMLYCLGGTFNSGGMEKVVVDKVNWLANNGFNITVVTTEQNGRKDFFPLDERIRRIDLDIQYTSTIGFNPLRKFFARSNRLRLHRKNLQSLVDSLNPDIIISTCGNEIGIIPKIKTNAKKIAEIHFSRWYRLQNNRKGIWWLFDKVLTSLDRHYLRRYDKFVVLTKEDALNWGQQSNMVVIPNFITSVSPEPAPLENKKMIAVGRLSYQKGYDRMISAWEIVAQKYPDWKLDIYGAGELKSALEQLIQSKNLQDKIFIYDPTVKINEIYKNYSALLLSSRYEGLPMVLLESMANGLPPISFACQCGPRDVIEDEINGILVKNGDISSFADAIIKIIENNSFRSKLGRKAYERAYDYQIDKIMTQWVNLFKSLSFNSNITR